MTGLQVTGLQSAVIPHFHGVGVRVVKGTLQMGSGLALRIVHKYEAILLIQAELVGPAPRVIGAAVCAPDGRCSAGSRPGPVAAAAGLTGHVLGVLAGALLICFRIAAVLILGFLPWVMHGEKEETHTHTLWLDPALSYCCFSSLS